MWDGTQLDMGGSPGEQGTVGALSLHLRVLDLNERELFFGAGGVQPAGRLEGGFSRTFQAVPDTSLAADDTFNRNAIDLALDGLPSRGPAPASAPQP